MLGLSLSTHVGGNMLSPSARLAHEALIILRFGTDAHVYLPGIGTLSGLQAANYLLSDGSTGNTTVDGVTGLVLDAMGSVGAELAPATTSTSGFSSVSSGLSSDGARLTITNSGASQGYAGFGATVGGKTYRVTINVVSASGNGSVQVGGNATALTGVGATTRYIVATSGGGFFIGTNTTVAGNFIVIDNISVREVTGIHASQPTTAAKPRLERGARNLFKQSGDISNAAHTAALVTGATALDYQTVSCTATNNSGYRPEINAATDSFVAPAVGVYTLSFEIASGTLNSVFIGIDAGNCTLTHNAAGGIVALNPAFVKISITLNITAVGTVFRLQLFNQTLSAGTFKVRNFQYETGPTASDYSPTTTAAASNPNAGRYSWAFDGGDSLSLGSVPFQMADDFWIVAGSRTDVISNSPDVFSQASTASANPLIKLGFDSFGKPIFALRDDAGTLALLADPGISRQFITCTLSGRKVGNMKALRVNGLEVLNNNTAMGATTFTGAAVGVRPTSVLANYFAGSTGPIAFGKGTISDADLLTIERLVASLTPNAPTF